VDDNEQPRLRSVADEPGIGPTTELDDARRRAEREFLAARDAYLREHGIELSGD
jgi:hypothetical protein